ncbi:hypothetical protein [Sporomusa sp. KB1]|jgi:hypothetical protein|uniref:hypothetical protein n=1 Tax=Sporomusa sp. KB1 TaxID=943346 RepID=UPI00119D7C43|nr:hypothetical protein [Sporomusa sp. KB1]TWH47650.1 hypothetical protein Salpa_3717 [Sporomusa sp. KB1]
MSNQYFWQYLLHKGLLTHVQLCEVLKQEQPVKVKLGILAMNAGLMNAAQVGEIHNLQRVKDQKFGVLAVSQGYLTNEQVEELLTSQGEDHLSLMQSIADKGYMTFAGVEKALGDFREEYSLTEDNDEESRVIRDLVDFSAVGDRADVLYLYVGLTLRNIVRFLNDTPYILTQAAEKSATYFVSQQIFGDIALGTGLRVEQPVLLELAGRFYGESFTAVNELALDSAGEFLNVHNGVFCSSLSDMGLVVDLKAQSVQLGDSFDGQSFRVNIGTSFGQIELILSI